VPDAKTSKTQTKAAFVRSLPSTTPIADVVAKAKEAGVTLTPKLVHRVRRAAKPRGTAKKTAAAKTTVSAKKTSASMKPVESKAAFVRGLPTSTPAKDVVKLAKAAGIKIGIRYVYNIRGTAKLAAKKKRAAAKSPMVSAVANDGGSMVSSRVETLLKALGAELGLGNAIAILSGERARVTAVIGG
jgi:hypothetical protein